MKKAVCRTSRRALTAALVISSCAATQATAQEIASDLPLNEICVSGPFYTCPTPVVGRRTITTIVRGTSTPVPDGRLLQGVANVDFDGQLQVSGYPTQSVPDFLIPASDLEYIGQNIEILAATNFDIAYALLYPFDFDPRYSASPLDAGSTFTINSLDVSQIDVDLQNETFEFADGSEGEFTLTSIDPTNIVNNGTTLSGKFSSTDGKIVFGTLNGTATVVPASGPTTVIVSGNVPVDIVSPLALDLALVPTVLTQLDETGLVTPKIAVTGGIEMNGSAITGLAAGVNATDAVNKGQLDSETAARAAGDAQLANALNTETADRVSADAALATAISTEAGQRAVADTQLANAIQAEASTRAAGDAQIVVALSEEATVRANADTGLNTRIAANSADIANVRGLSVTETAARIAADNALAARIDTFGSRLDLMEGRLELLDDRIAGSTAVATAMSGNAFLPDMSFNLTANVATYDGAHAGSLQLGALVSPNVAVNAGVATGFNKQGKTAGRVGLTLGW